MLGLAALYRDSDLTVAALRSAVQVDPAEFDAWNSLGVALGHRRNLPEAEAALHRAIRLQPPTDSPWTNLGNLLCAAHCTAEQKARGIAAYRAALDRAPRSYIAANNLAIALKDSGDLIGALSAADQAIANGPMESQGYSTRGNIFRALERFAEARDMHGRALSLDPARADYHTNMGLVLLGLEDNVRAERHFRAADRIHPDRLEYQVNLGTFLSSINSCEEAEGLFKEALKKDPTDLIAWLNLGGSLYRQDKSEEAADAFRQVLRLDPGNEKALFSLSVVLWSLMEVQEALEIFDRIDPAAIGAPRYWNFRSVLCTHLLDQAEARKSGEMAIADSSRDCSFYYSNYLFNAHYLDQLTKQELFDLHCGWDQRFGSAVHTRGDPHPHDRDPERRLRIGYISPDFRRHSVAYFSGPIIDRHDRSQFEVYCYYTGLKEDSVSRNFAEITDHWHSVAGLSRNELEELILSHRIDILVDLAGHTGNNALQIMARKLAPVQVTYLGYPNTTGLKAIDWRLTDIHADPPDRDVDQMSEIPWRLRRSFLLFREADKMPDAASLPMETAGHFTIGSFNNISKAGPRSAEAWQTVLDAVPGSRLLLKARSLSGTRTRAVVADRLASWGLDMARVDIVAYAGTLVEHLETYGRVDVAVDTTPYNGTTTTLEAAWMGVPTLTLRGKRHCARVGTSIMTNLGLADRFVAEDLPDLAAKARALAADPAGLAVLRKGLRRRVQDSPLQDETGFMMELEAAYREMWRRWCAGPVTYTQCPPPLNAEAVLEDAVTPVV